MPPTIQRFILFVERCYGILTHRIVVSKEFGKRHDRLYVDKAEVVHLRGWRYKRRGSIVRDAAYWKHKSTHSRRW